MRNVEIGGGYGAATRGLETHHHIMELLSEVRAKRRNGLGNIARIELNLPASPIPHQSRRSYTASSNEAYGMTDV